MSHLQHFFDVIYTINRSRPISHMFPDYDFQPFTLKVGKSYALCPRFKN